MLRLVACLDREPKQLLMNYPPVEASYDLCLSRLEQVYGGTERRRQGRIVDEENLLEVRKFISTLEAVDVALAETGESVSCHGTLYMVSKERLSQQLLRIVF